MRCVARVGRYSASIGPPSVEYLSLDDDGPIQAFCRGYDRDTPVLPGVAGWHSARPDSNVARPDMATGPKWVGWRSVAVQSPGPHPSGCICVNILGATCGWCSTRRARLRPI